MSGSSSTTRIRWVIPGLVLEGRHEYRGRVGGAGKPDASTCRASAIAGSRESACVSAGRRPTSECVTLLSWRRHQHLIGTLQDPGALLLAYSGRLVTHGSRRNPAAGRRHFGASSVTSNLKCKRHMAGRSGALLRTGAGPAGAGETAPGRVHDVESER